MAGAVGDHRETSEREGGKDLLFRLGVGEIWTPTSDRT